jgi:hypothetical protein
VLFLFDPIQLASHTWFLPKLILIGLGVINAAIFRRGAWDRALAGSGACRKRRASRERSRRRYGSR